MIVLATEELARLRMPLPSLPGFDPLGLRDRHGFGARGLIVGVELGRVWHHGANYPVPCEDVHLYLADAATRDRVVRWIAARLGLEIGSTAPGWRFTTNGDGGWWIDAGHAPIFRRTAPSRDDLDPYVPALADLDPADDRRLPDGSRYVDALALTLCAWHVGRTHPFGTEG